MEADLPVFAHQPLRKKCLQFSKMYSNNPFGAPRRAEGSPTPSHDHIFRVADYSGKLHYSAPVHASKVMSFNIQCPATQGEIM
jgi:hypothetical protein